MNKYEEIIDFIYTNYGSNLNTSVLSKVDIILKRIFVISPTHLDLLLFENITNPVVNELWCEWFFGSYYVQIKVSETECRCEAKLLNGERHIKVHSIPMKITNSIIQCIDSLIGIN